MKRITLSVLSSLLCLTAVLAIPASRDTVWVRQPDGTILSLCLHGDEYLHFTTTVDGYTVIHDGSRGWVYAGLTYAASDITAHNPTTRDDAEQAWLSSCPKWITPMLSQTVAEERTAEQQRRRCALQRVLGDDRHYDYTRFRGLVILVDYADKKFHRDDYAAIVDDMVNQENYQGYDNTTYGRFTGSVRDYFADNSMGRFVPVFDVVGPVTISHSQYDADGTQNAAQLMADVVEKADALVDFSQYDGDDDGITDMVFFIFAGNGSNVGGNDQRLLWPHAGQLRNPRNMQPIQKDGIALGRYACSTEMGGTVAQAYPDGIGVICHEFSHVLGLPDFYDTDYSGSGGQSSDPALWSLMASGAYRNNSRTPVGYTLFERYAVGFAQPELLTSEGSYTLRDLAATNRGYRLDTRQAGEFFLIENRQNTSRWDAYLPGHGMLVFRVDSTSSAAWQNNTVNTNPLHNYFQLLRAAGDGQQASADPFPGTRQVTALTNNTQPAALLTWAGLPSVFGFDDIAEDADGNITFRLIDINELRQLTMQPTMLMSLGTRRQLTPQTDPSDIDCDMLYESSDESVVTVTADGTVEAVGEGEAVVTLTATDSHAGSMQATCRVTVEDQTVCDGIAAFRQLASGEQAWLVTDDAVVTYVYTKGNLIFMRDDTGALAVQRTGLQQLGAGDVVSGQLFGRYATSNRIPQLQTVSGKTSADGLTIVAGGTAEPRCVDIGQLTADDYGDYVRLEGATLVGEGNTVYAVSGDLRLMVYNVFGISTQRISDYDGHLFDVEGIYYTRKVGTAVVDVLALTRSISETSTDGICDVVADRQTHPGRYFDLSGRQIDGSKGGKNVPGKGVYFKKGRRGIVYVCP